LGVDRESADGYVGQVPRLAIATMGVPRYGACRLYDDFRDDDLVSTNLPCKLKDFQIVRDRWQRAALLRECPADQAVVSYWTLKLFKPFQKWLFNLRMIAPDHHLKFLRCFDCCRRGLKTASNQTGFLRTTFQG
jgi:hypothetical protein